MIYSILRRVIKLALHIFFKKIIVTGEDLFPEQGPVIIVANHPNTLMDVLIIASISGNRIGFVANAGIFSNAIMTGFLRYFQVIPIFRKKDVRAGEKTDNNASFRKCHEYLGEGKSFLIFPEGSSIHELNLREIKTGTARIALSFEKLRNFEGGLNILPVALDYSDILQFRSMVSVTIEPAISVSKYKEIYLSDEIEGVNELTEDIRKELAKNVPQTSGKEQEDFLIKAHKFYTAYNEPGAALYEDPGRSLDIRNQLARALTYIQIHESRLYEDIKIRMDSFFAELRSSRLTVGFFTNEFLKKSKVMVCLGYLFTFLFLSPFYIAGLITNYLPYILPSKIFFALKIDIEYKSSVQLLSGMVLFPFFYFLEFRIFRNYVSDDVWSNVFFLILLPSSGFITMFLYTELLRFARVLRFYFFLKASEKKKLLGLRDEILERIGVARKKFFS